MARRIDLDIAYREFVAAQEQMNGKMMGPSPNDCISVGIAFMLHDIAVSLRKLAEREGGGKAQP